MGDGPFIVYREDSGRHGCGVGDMVWGIGAYVDILEFLRLLLHSQRNSGTDA